MTFYGYKFSHRLKKYQSLKKLVFYCDQLCYMIIILPHFEHFVCKVWRSGETCDNAACVKQCKFNHVRLNT